MLRFEEALFGKRVVGGEGDAEGFFGDGMPEDGALVALGFEDEVEGAGFKAVAHFLGGGIEPIDADAGKLLGEAGEGFFDEAAGEGGGVADIHFDPFDFLLHAFQALRAGGENAAAFAEHGVASFGELDGLFASFEEGPAEAFFEGADLAAEGGLGDAEFAGGLGDVRCFGDGDEVSQLTEVEVFYAHEAYLDSKEGIGQHGENFLWSGHDKNADDDSKSWRSLSFGSWLAEFVAYFFLRRA